jgi:hypothetical protein
MHATTLDRPGRTLGWQAIVVLVVLGLLVSMLAFAAPTRAATVHYVDGAAASAAPGTGCGTDAGYATIQAAINAAGAGDTISVCAGTYAENLTVDVANLTLAGPNAGTPATAARVAEAVIVGSFAVGANQDGITINGFRVQGPGTVRGLGVTVANNVFVASLSTQHGLTTSSSAPVRPNSFTISDNSFTGYNQALRLDGGNQTQSLLISGNLVSSNSRAVQTFASLHAGPVGDDTVPAAQIIDNVFTNNADGIRLALGGFDVHRNVISGNANYGLRVGTGAATSATDATCNWWGDASGPSGAGSGSGDALIIETGATVVFDPWSKTAAAEQPCLVLTPNEDKQAVLAELEDMRDNGGFGAKTVKRIQKAIDRLTKSLTAEWWIDDETLDEKDGKKVFGEEKKVVKELTKKELRDNPVAQDLVQDILDVDRALAAKAIADAEATPGAKQKDIDKAHEELAKGDAERAAGKFDKAVDKYKKAWENAQKAMK